MKEYIEENYTEILKMCRKEYNRELYKFMEFYEFVNQVVIDLLQYGNKYDKEKSKLTTYIYSTILNERKQLLRKIYGQGEFYEKTNKVQIENNSVSFSTQINEGTNGKELFLQDVVPDNKDYFKMSNIKEALQKVKKKYPKESKVLFLKIEGYEYKEISDMLSISFGTITNYLNKCRKYLKRII